MRRPPTPLPHFPHLAAAALAVALLASPAAAPAAPTLPIDIPLGNAGPAGVAVDSANQRAYVVTRVGTAGAVKVIDTTNNTVILPDIPTLDNPFHVAVDPVRGKLFVGIDPGAVQIFNISGNTPHQTVFGLGPSVSGLAVDPASGKVYVGVLDAQAVKTLVPDGAMNYSIGPVFPVNDGPIGVTINPVTRRVYAAIHHAQQVAVIDAATDTFLGHFPVPSGDPTWIAATTCDNRVHVAYSLGNAISTLDADDPALPLVLPRAVAGDQPRFIAANTRTNRVYVASLNFQRVTVIDSTTNTVEATVPMAGVPDDLAVDESTACVYVSVRDLTNFTDHKVRVFCDPNPECRACSEQPLGTANGFSLFVTGDLTQQFTDTGGRVAAGGDATLTGYGVGVQLPFGSLGDSLVVGGDLVFTNGSVNGDVAHGGTATLSGVFVSGTVSPGTPIDFTAERAELEGLSAFWASLPANGTSSFSFGSLLLSGTDPDLNVFDVSSANLASTTFLQITAPATSTVVVNVDGAVNQMQGFGMALVGVPRQQVLFNFPATTDLTIQFIGVEGSVLAPMADVAFNNGIVNGTLIGGSVSGGGQTAGSGQTNLPPFDGCLPTDIPCEPVDDRPVLPGVEPPSRRLVANSDTPVFVTVLRGEGAAFNNLVTLPNATQYFSKDEVTGTRFFAGHLAAGGELILQLTTPESNTFTIGPGSRNGDGLVHANVTEVSPGVFVVGWEDLLGGGDRDYDDTFLQVCGDLSLVSP